VNTAARMESNGEPMRIHMSQSTASLLTGRSALIPRNEIFVKGKGRMSTWFMDVSDEAEVEREREREEETENVTLLNIQMPESNVEEVSFQRCHLAIVYAI
jgi:class 3 adenylate cyclase